MGAEGIDMAHDFKSHGGGTPVQAGMNQLSDPNLNFPWSQLDHRQAFNHAMLVERPRILLNAHVRQIRKRGGLGEKSGPRERRIDPGRESGSGSEYVRSSPGRR